MKKAKFALTAVAVLAVIGGALAFKANRQNTTFFSYGTTTIDGQQQIGCVVPVLLQRTTNPGGVITPYLSTLSTTLNPAVCTTRVIVNP